MQPKREFPPNKKQEKPRKSKENRLHFGGTSTARTIQI
jgi:hypothetical protein